MKSNEREIGAIERCLDWFQLSPSALNEGSAHKRRFTQGYRQRLMLVRDSWLYGLSGLLVLGVSAPFVLSVCIFSTFVSLAFLDEVKLH